MWPAHSKGTILALPAPSPLPQQLLLPSQQKCRSSTSGLLLSLCFWCSRGLKELWLQPSAVCAHTMSAPLEQPEHLTLTDREGQERDLPGGLSSITNPVADEHSASCRLRPSGLRWGQIKASHIPCCDTYRPSTACIFGDHPKPALANPKSSPALGYGEATSAELPRKKVGKGKGVQCSGQRRRKEQAMNQIRNQWNPHSL